MKSSRRAFLTTLTAVSVPVLSNCQRNSMSAKKDVRESTLMRWNAPDTRFDLREWKLQIPGPKEVKNLGGYASKYFYLNWAGQMCFWVNCAESGHTANSDYVRSELRHLANWYVNDAAPKQLSATVSVNSNANPNKVTVLQIHGITDDGDNAPPLLRVALNHGSLYAWIKTDNSGRNTDSIVLNSDLGAKQFSCAIAVRKQRLIISTNGIEKVNRDISFWQYANYFKAGCYPQSHDGTVTVMFSNLSVNVS